MDFSGVTVLVLGDVMLDHYIAGCAHRVSPEAPVPVVSRQKSWTVPGGAANVARGLARLGCNARLVGLVGNDAPGLALVGELDAEGINNAIITAQNRPTTCKTRIIAHGQQLLRLDDEVNSPPNRHDALALKLAMLKLAPGSSAIVLSDYDKGVLASDKFGQCLCREAIDLAKGADIPVLVDPKGTDWSKYQGANCITPNMAEFLKICQTIGLDEPDLRSESLQRLANAVCHKFNIERLLLTQGAAGMILFEPDLPPLHIKAARRDVADVSGAGDTVIATLAACVGKRIPWNEGAKIANAAAGVAVGKTGTAPVDLDELNLVLRQEPPNSKLYTARELKARIRDWRQQGQRIVFTNGCFDLLHPGHISLLRQAASMGDRLVVGLNSDASVRRLKGDRRPIQNEESRAALLSAISFVDAVAIFEQDTPLKLIEEVKPDVLVKGSDYDIKNVVGADFVQSYGGKVRLVDLVQGFSTSSLEQKIRQSGR